MTNKAQHHLDQAYVCNEQGDWTQALQQCELAIQFTYDLADAHNLRGIILEQLGRRKEAIAAYDEAVYIDPDLKKAQENLDRARVEMQKFKSDLYQRRIKAALPVAIAYGISFSMVEVIILLFRMQKVTQTTSGFQTSYFRYGRFFLLVIATLLYALIGFIGPAALAKIARPARYKLFVAAGVFGFASAYFMTDILIQIFMPVLETINPNLKIIYTMPLILPEIKLAVAGACSGILMRIIQAGFKDGKRLAWSALAGTAFALPELFSSYAYDLALSISASGLIPGSLEDKFHVHIVFSIAYAIHGAIIGIVGGAMLGLAMAQPGGIEGHDDGCQMVT